MYRRGLLDSDAKSWIQGKMTRFAPGLGETMKWVHLSFARWGLLYVGGVAV